MSNKNLLEEMKLDLDKYLQEYLTEGFATYEFDLLAGRGPKIKVRTISVSGQMAVESSMKDTSKEDIPLYRMHKYQLEFLSHVLLKVGNKEFKSPEEVMNYITEKGLAFADKVSKVQSTFEQLFRTELSSDDIENFSQTPSTGTELQ